MTALQSFQSLLVVCNKKLCLNPTMSVFSRFTLVILTKSLQVDATNPLAQSAVNENEALSDPYQGNFFTVSISVLSCNASGTSVEWFYSLPTPRSLRHLPILLTSAVGDTPCLSVTIN